MMNVTLQIRTATEDDLLQIASIKVDGWQTAYRKIIDKETLDNLSVDQEIKSLQKYALKDIFIVENHADILGFCRVYDYATPQYNSDVDCEIREIYVRSDRKGLGIGSKLFNYVLNDFQKRRKRKLYLGVLEENYPARNFYEKMGGKFFEKSHLTIDGKEYPTVSYIYQLK